MCKASCKICALLRGPPLCPPPHGHFMAKQWWHATEKSQITVRPGKPIYIYKAELLGQVPSQSTVANSHTFTHTHSLSLSLHTGTGSTGPMVRCTSLMKVFSP